MENQRMSSAVTGGIARLSDPRHRDERHKLVVSGGHYVELGMRWQCWACIDRRSVQHLVDFLDSGEETAKRVTALKLFSAGLVFHPSPDGGLEVLRNFFARNCTTLTKVTLKHCEFGTPEDTSHLLTGFHTNRTVTYLTIGYIHLEGAALGNSVSRLIQNMPQLQRLSCLWSPLMAEGIRAMQPGLCNNQTLKELDLYLCQISDEGVRALADALVGNTTMELLILSDNNITPQGLRDITRMIESTRLQTIAFAYSNKGIFENEDVTQNFVSTLRQAKSSVQELTGVDEKRMGVDEKSPESGSRAATVATNVKNSLTRNRQLNRVNLLLLARQPQHQQQQRCHAGTSVMFKISHKAITEFAAVPDNVGASAIFKLFQARPQLLEKRLKQPPPPPPPPPSDVSAATLNPSPSKVLRNIASKL
jgi:Leucine Rich repeat